MSLVGWARGHALLCVLASGSAMAADLAPITRATPAPILDSWTGCHAGLEAGVAWGSSQHIHDDTRQPAFVGVPLTGNYDVSGAVVGGTLGCDYQVGRWVVGIEDDLSWAPVKGSGHIIPPFLQTTDLDETNEKWLDTLRLRVGLTWDRWLVYATGGGAFADVGINLCSPLAVACGSSSQTVTGWTVGVGTEYAFRKNWTAKIEYLHIDLGKTLFAKIPVGSGSYLARDVTLTNEIVRVGVNYKFDWFVR